jgi:hypothetical protein
MKCSLAVFSDEWIIDNQWLFDCEFSDNGDASIDKWPTDAFGRIDMGRAKA